MNLATKRMIALNEAKVDLLVAIGNEIAVAVNVAKLYEHIFKKAEEIRNKKEELEFFAYTISHDLKNPAVGLSGFARLLAEKYEDKLDEKGKMYCRQIH
jgi:light-regulated signal transduction histidine kinase (bacteriophytochrome)